MPLLQPAARLAIRAKRNPQPAPTISAAYAKLPDMPNLPRRSQQLIDSTPVRRVRTGSRTIIEVTAYADGHANIAVGDLDTSARGAPQYQRADSLPLNHRAELEQFLEAILDRVFAAAAAPDTRRDE